MADTIEIFKLEIDLDAAVDAASELKKESDSLKSSLEVLRKAGDTSSKTYVKLKGELDNVNKEYRVSQKQVQQITSLQAKNINTVKDARTALSLVGVEWARQAKLYGVNSKEAEALGKKKLELTKRLKEVEAATGDTSRNVGNYTESIGKAFASNTIFSKSLAVINQIMGLAKPIYKAVSLEIKSIAASYTAGAAAANTFSGAQKRAAIATNLVNTALKLFKVALIATGIGALLVLLGSAVAFFSKTQRGVDAVSRAMAGFGAFIDVIIDRMSAMFEAVTKIFSGNILGGLKDLTGAFSGVGDEISREISLAVELERALQKLEDREIGLIETQAARKLAIEELRIAAKDELLDLNERARLLEQAGQLEQAILNDRLEIAKEQARISQEQLDLGESSREEIKKNAEVQANFLELQTQSLKLQRSIEAEKQGLQKRARAQAETDAKAATARRKAATNEAIKQNETLLKLFIEQNKGRVKTLEDGKFNLQVVLTEELAILQQKLDAEKITREEFELEVLRAKNRFLEAETQLTIDFANKELDAIKDKNQSRIDENALLTDALVQEEQTRLDLILEKQKEFEAKRLAEGVISQEEFNARIAEVDEENRLAKEELNLELKEQKAEAEAIDFANEQAIRVERDGLIFEARLAELARIQEAEIADAKKKGADISKIDAKFAAIRTQIKEDEANNKLQLQSDLFGGIATLLGKETVAGKAAGIAQATINTFQGVSEVWRTKSTLPEPFATISKVVNTGVVLGSGLAAVSKIKGTNTNVPKGARGLTMRGRSHSQGGEGLFDRSGNQLAEIEGGENLYVVNRRASSLINSLSNINEATGGIPLSQATKYGVSGGLIERAISSNAPSSQRNFNVVDPQAIGEAVGARVGEEIANLPPPQVAVTDINDGQTNLAEVIDGASQ